MNYFPTPYPDEILYSVLARYSVRSGNISDIHVIEDLYSTRNIIASVELPCKMDALIKNLPVNSPYTAECLIDNHTLFPYYTAFLPNERANEVISAMRYGRGSKPYTMMGISSGFIKLNDYLRFCPECFKEDLQLYGETYWHRLHQITGVFICPKHKIHICNSKVLIRSGNRQRYIPATEKNCIIDIKGNSNELSKDLFTKMLWMAQDIDYILNQAKKPEKDWWYTNLFNERLVYKGYARMNNYIKQKELRADFINFYGQKYLTIMQSEIDTNHNNWLASMVRQSNYSTFTCRYLLLAQFLDINVEELFTNPKNKDGSFQSLWDARLIELTNQKISIREIALIMKSCTKTIRKRIDELGIDHYWIDNRGGKYRDVSYVKTNEFIDKREDYRNQWLELLKDYPDKSSNQIRKSNQAIYRWLTKYDLEWLRKRSRQNRQRTIIDWDKRDEELLPKVKEIVQVMYGPNKPQRISWGTIGSRLGISGWLEKSKDKLPKTKEYMNTVNESLEEYQIRKIVWALNELENRGIRVTKWNLLEMAGVKPRYLCNISVEVSVILEEKGYELILN